jgi:hypothetical protein
MRSQPSNIIYFSSQLLSFDFVVAKFYHENKVLQYQNTMAILKNNFSFLTAKINDVAWL